MGNVTITADQLTNGSFTLISSGDSAVTASGTTVDFTPPTSADSVITVTVVPGTQATIQGTQTVTTAMTFTGSVVFPSLLGDGSQVTLSPGTVSVNSNGDYVFTCTDAITDGTAITEDFSITTRDGHTFKPHDPSMVFNPPE